MALMTMSRGQIVNQTGYAKQLVKMILLANVYLDIKESFVIKVNFCIFP